MTDEADRKLRVLLVDDEPLNLDVLAGLFRGLYSVTAVKSGEQALACASGPNRPDLVLLDVMMPEMDGYEVCRRLKADERTREIPIVFVTAKSDVGDETKGLDLGAVDYLAKPISPPIVLARVKGILSRVMLQRQVDEMQRTFTAMIVHDLRNPLNVITGFTELALSEPAVEESFELRTGLQRVLENALRASLLVSQMLDLTQLRAGRVTLEPVELDVSGLLQRLASDQELLARGKKIRLETAIEPGLSASADPLKLAEVVMNLIGNALKFTPAGGTITLAASFASEHRLRISVTDTGPGIPPEEVVKLFVPWRQVAGTNKRAVRGHGLGLAICRMIVEAHGGAIGLESDVGNGAAFSFWIPSASVP
jgi:two-component system sensor histidine kinase/response regulator